MLVTPLGKLPVHLVPTASPSWEYILNEVEEDLNILFSKIAGPCRPPTAPFFL